MVPPQKAVLGPHDRLNVVVVKLTKEQLTPLMKGHDLVVAITSGWPKQDAFTMTNLSDSARAYFPAMKACGIKRYFTVLGSSFLGPIDDIPYDWEDTGDEETDSINKIRRDMRRVWDLV